MADATYYFNGHSASDWADPNNFDDGSILTFASAGSGDIHTFNSNTCPGTDLGIITKVEIRVHAYGDGNDRIDLTPVFVAGDGDEHQTTPAGAPAWGSYRDITDDTNAPSPWTWADVVALGCKAEKANVSKGNTMYGSKLEVRVTLAWVPPESDIDVGADPIDRPASVAYGRTRADKNNPANASGILHTIQIWAALSMTGLRVGTFYTTNGNTLKCRDSVLIGNVTAGSTQTFNGLSIAVETGDYIGCYFAEGFIEESLSGYDGLWVVEGEYIDPNDETTYTFYADRAISLYGYGDIPSVGARHGFVNFQIPGIV